MDKETAKLIFELLDSAQGHGWNHVKKMNHVADALTKILQEPAEKKLKAVKDGNT